jgi:hypothetical protein
VPASYATLAYDLAEATDVLAQELVEARDLPELAEAARPALLALGEASAAVERSDQMTAEGVLLQLRSVIVDLLQLTGMGQFEATDAMPPPPS